MADSESKKVLVFLGKQSWPISFQEGENEPKRVLEKARFQFKDVLEGDEDLILIKVKDKDWFIDIMPNETIPNKSILEIVKVPFVEEYFCIFI